MSSIYSQTVIVVESNPTVLELYTQALALAGYVTIACANDAQAIDVLHQQVPALLVLNPGPQGVPTGDVVHLVQRDPRLVDVPILIGSTSPRPIDRSPIGPRSRSWGTIAKPFDLPLLLDVVDSLARRSVTAGSGSERTAPAALSA
jgi:DNA-binding response OmpR family regulator